MKFNIFRKIDRKDSFWKWFSKKESELYTNFEDNKELFIDEISNILKEIDQNLTFEVGTIKEGGKREFIISADGIADSFETVENLYNAAPAFRNWEIIKFRPRMNSESLEINMGDIKLSYDDIYFIHEDNGHYIDLNIYIENYNPNEDRYDFAYFILLDSLIGEYDAVTKIGDTRLHELTSQEKNKVRRFAELTAIVDDLHK